MRLLLTRVAREKALPFAPLVPNPGHHRVLSSSSDRASGKNWKFPAIVYGSTMQLEDLRPRCAVRGVHPDGVVTVVSVQWFGSEAVELTYKTQAGAVANELL